MRRFASVGSLLLLVLPVLAASAPPRIVDRTTGEEDQIHERREWFFKSRRAGTRDGADMARLRHDAVVDTAGRIAILRQRAALDGVDTTNVWVSIGPAPSHFGGWAFGDVAGRITALARDAGRDILYVATAAGGLWKSTNDGASYVQLFDAAGTHTLGAIAIDPNDPDVLWAGTGDFVEGCDGYFGIGLLRSVDGGVTWTSRNGSGAATLEDLSSFSSVLVDPRSSSHLVVGGVTRGCSSGVQQVGGLFTTTDAGLTWTKRLADTEIDEIAQDPTNRDIWWAATTKGIYKSVDNAVTWILQTASSLPNGSTGRTELAIAPSSSTTVYALFASGPTGSEFWRTTNGGSTWQKMSSGNNACDGQCWYNMAIRVHPTTPTTVYRGTVHIFKSIDSGTTWTDLSNAWGSAQKAHQDTHVLMTDAANPEWLYVGSDGGVWKSTNGGSSFTNKNANLNVTQFYGIDVHPTDPGVVCGGAQDNSSLARSGVSNVWDLQEVTGDGFICQIDPVDPNYSFLTSYPGSFPNIYRSTTGVFGNYDIVTNGGGIASGDRIEWVTPYILDPRSPNVVYLGTHRVYKSVDHGTSWTQVGPTDMTAGSGDVFTLEVNRNFPGVVYAATTDPRIWRSANAGSTWTNISSGLPARTVTDVAGDPTNAARAFATVGGFGTAHLWEWTGSGSWIARGGGLPNVPANTVLLLTASDIVVGTDVGVFRSTDGGVSFTPFMSGLPQGLVVTDLKLHAPTNMLTAGTYGRGAWQVSLDPVEPIVIYDSIVLPMVEVDGDGDGSVEPGETWQVTPVLRNAGGQAALGVTATLGTATPGVTLDAPSGHAFGDVAPGGTSAAAQPFTFSVSPSFPCGSSIAFDLTAIHSTNGPGSYADLLGAFSVSVVGVLQPDTVTTILDEDFDPAPPTGWTHEKITPTLSGCTGLNYKDEWKIAVKDAAHNQSYHCGNGPGSQYGTPDYAWLYVGGKDSTNGPGLVIPADAATATLTVTHWYNTQSQQDGGDVVLDAVENDQDVYSLLVPVGGYPQTLRTGFCNGLEGKPAFSGSSAGWTTSTFDLSPYVGRRVYLAFVFGSDRFASQNEGWYLDLVKLESNKPGQPVCEVTVWPGSVPDDAQFARNGDGTVTASWSPSCNAASVPGQGYSLQAGDLDALNASGTYTHAPIAGQCAFASPATFTPGTGNEYYLIVPNSGGAREGGAGTGAGGAARPQSSAVCGERRTEACP